MISEIEERNLMLETLLDFSEELQDWITEHIPANLNSHKRACLYVEITRVLWFKSKEAVEKSIEKLIKEYSA